LIEMYSNRVVVLSISQHLFKKKSVSFMFHTQFIIQYVSLDSLIYLGS